MAEVSLSLSAASAATAWVAPRPTTNREAALASVSTAGRGRRGGRQIQDRRQLGERGEKLAVLAPVGHERGARHERGDHRLGRRHRALGARMQRQEGVGVARERGVLVVDHRNRHGALVSRRPLHRDDIRASARLRNGDRDGVGEPQRRMIERGERWPERSAGERGLELDEMLEIEGRMIGAAAGDRDRERRFARSQCRRQLGRRRRVGGQLAAGDRAALRDLRGHEGRAQRGAPSARCRELEDRVNSATKSKVSDR